MGRLNLNVGRDGVVKGRKYTGMEGEALYDETYQYFKSRAIMRCESVIWDVGDNRFIEYEPRDGGGNVDNDGGVHGRRRVMLLLFLV